MQAALGVVVPLAFQSVAMLALSFPTQFIVANSGDQLVGIAAHWAAVQALELAGGVEGEVEYFTIRQSRGNAVASSIVVMGEFIFALPIRSYAAIGIVFPAQFAVGIFRFN
ncbi:hypothetical protein [Microbulbifer okhotskensis]|uniref:hypothetical protein n=1 Tax=Microbulbifer okhotskensis TaxID=2926617 RepID=UPI004038BA4F